MEKPKVISFSLLPSFQNKEEYFEKLIDEKYSVIKIVNLLLLMILFSFLYGVAVGSYHSFAQAVAAGIKIPVLFLLALIICLPALFIIQYTLGSKLKLHQMVSIIISGFVLTTSIMVSFIPIVIFFLLTGGNYYFLQLLHIAIVALSGFFGIRMIVEALKYSCEKKGVYPKIGVTVFKFWFVILAIVGIQLAWNLRPFTGDQGKPFALFREYEGNFYAAIIYSINQLLEGNNEPNVKYKIPKENNEQDSLFLFRR
ncbi:MAG: hypothetical protein FJ213_13215 [Ignavibacteria bacterium]|nr:hypothetical protein [Ignavibacteria bacterium]